MVLIGEIQKPAVYSPQLTHIIRHQSLGYRAPIVFITVDKQHRRAPVAHIARRTELIERFSIEGFPRGAMKHVFDLRRVVSCEH